VASLHNVRRLSELNTLTAAEARGDGRLPTAPSIATLDEMMQPTMAGGGVGAPNAAGDLPAPPHGGIDMTDEEWEEVKATSWPAFRFGVEVNDVFERTLESVIADHLTFSSERIAFAGSVWNLDIKRHERTTRQEFAAVYLRRRSPRVSTLDRWACPHAVAACVAAALPTSVVLIASHRTRGLRRHRRKRCDQARTRASSTCGTA